MMPKVVALHLTYQCPLKCAHCCVDAGPSRREALDEKAVIRLVKEASQIGTVDTIGLTGGDPFLMPKLINAALGETARLGLRCTIITSAFWAKTFKQAEHRLDSLVRYPDEMGLSYDTAHAEFVPVEHLLHAYRAAMQRRCKIRILLGTEPSSTVTSEWMLGLLRAIPEHDEALTTIEISNTVSTGRAADDAGVEQRKAASNKYLGPCHTIFNKAAVNPQGKILACCGTIPYKDGLCGGDIDKLSLQDAVNIMNRDSLLRWIALDGPVAILEDVTQVDLKPVTGDDVDGICHACDVMFSDPMLARRAADAATARTGDIAVREVIRAAREGR